MEMEKRAAARGRGRMSAALTRILRRARRTVPGLAPRLDEIDFHSGLGDSAYLLYGLARALKPQVAVEIGSARGKSACYVGRALKENGSGRLFAIDPHTRTNWNDEDSIDTLGEMNATSGRSESRSRSRSFVMSRRRRRRAGCCRSTCSSSTVITAMMV